MHENGYTPSWKDKVRTAWKAMAAEPEPEPGSMQVAPHDNLRVCIAASDARHEAGPGDCVDYVHLASSDWFDMTVA